MIFWIAMAYILLDLAVFIYARNLLIRSRWLNIAAILLPISPLLLVAKWFGLFKKKEEQ